MQRMWRGAVTLLELSTVVLSSTTGSGNTVETERVEERREDRGNRERGMGENRRAHRRRWQDNSETMGPSWRMTRQFLSSSGLEEKQSDPRQQHLHIYCLHWIMGLADSRNPPTDPPNTHTHTHASTITIGPTVWMRGFSTVELKGNRLWVWLLPVAN